MAASFYFYDLETSGFQPRSARVMQFAGQRTDMLLNTIGEPINVLIKMTPDTVPDPDAVLITGITPQQTISEGLTEAEFLKLFYKQAVTPNTIFVGFNNIRFDDEFMRFMNYRNFYDAYEWQWQEGRSRWDLLDMIRMARAIRPDGIEWPFASDGKPTNRLAYLTSVNKLNHNAVHDALSDVQATIDLARLVRGKNKELFEYLLSLRTKQKISDLVLAGKPFVYTSGRYGSQYHHTTVAVLLDKHPKQDAALVYDLRIDPSPFLKMSIEQLIEAWSFSKESRDLRLPLKTLKFNRSPAVAPIGVIKNNVAQQRLSISLETVARHHSMLINQRTDFAAKILEVVDRLDYERERSQTVLVDDQLTVDERLYDSFIDKRDYSVMSAVRAASPDQLGKFIDSFHDPRLQNLLPLYKARNYPKSLSPNERQIWDEFCHKKLLGGGDQSRLAKYFGRLQELKVSPLSTQHQYLLEELRLYGESIFPSNAAD